MSKQQHQLSKEFVKSFDGLKIHYDTLGKPTPSLLNHGLWLMCGCKSGPLMDAIAEQTSAVFMNQRGSGMSEVPADLESYSIPAISNDMLHIMDSLGVKRGTIVAYSHAAASAVEMARSKPERCSGLVLIEPALFVDRGMLRERVALLMNGKPEEAVRLMLSYAAPGLHGKDLKEMVSAILENFSSPMGLAGDWSARSLYNVTEQSLSDIMVPTLVIGGTHSNIRADVKRIADAIPDASLWWVHNATHLIPYEKPREIVKAVMNFIDAGEDLSRPELSISHMPMKH